MADKLNEDPPYEVSVERTDRLARVLIADDHALVREGLRAVLEAEGGVQVVGEARDGGEAVKLCAELSPDVVLMDVRMPGTDGLEATRKIKARTPYVSVVMVTMHDNPDYLLEAVRAGAAGYVLKGDAPGDVLDAVRAVLSGDTPLDQGLAMQLLRHIGEEAAAQGAAASPRAGQATSGPVVPAMSPSLTPRETEVLVCLASGKTNRQIAKELHLSLSTVKRHLEHILPKLEVSDRTQAAVKAVEMGLLPPPGRTGRANPLAAGRSRPP